MLALDIQRNGSNVSVELPMNTNMLTGELRSIGIYEPLDKIIRSDFLLQPTNELGEHFMRMVQIDDTLQAIATASREFEVLEGDSRQALVDLIKENRLRDLDHMADYLQYGSDALDGLVRMERNDQSIVLPAQPQGLHGCLGHGQPLTEIRLAEVELTPVSELGRRLITALHPYSDSVATANAACALAWNVPSIVAGPAQVADAARALQRPLPTQTANFYCPLKVSVEDEDTREMTEGSSSLLVWNEEAIREALQAELGEGENMADYLPDGLQPKIASVEWDVAKIGRALYGKITCEMRAPLTEDEQNELIDWLRGQNSDGLGEGFEQRPISTDDGDLAVHLWHDSCDYYVLSEDAFMARFAQPEHVAAQDVKPEKPDCPLIGQDGKEKSSHP